MERPLTLIPMGQCLVVPQKRERSEPEMVVLVGILHRKIRYERVKEKAVLFVFCVYVAILVYWGRSLNGGCMSFSSDQWGHPLSRISNSWAAFNVLYFLLPVYILSKPVLESIALHDCLFLFSSNIGNECHIIF